jgi:hypothetical protein
VSSIVSTVVTAEWLHRCVVLCCTDTSLHGGIVCAMSRTVCTVASWLHGLFYDIIFLYVALRHHLRHVPDRRVERPLRLQLHSTRVKPKLERLPLNPWLLSSPMFAADAVLFTNRHHRRAPHLLDEGSRWAVGFVVALRELPHDDARSQEHLRIATH